MLIMFLAIIVVTLFLIMFRFVIMPKLSKEEPRYSTTSPYDIARIWSFIILGAIVIGLVGFVWIWAVVQYDQNRDKNSIEAAQKDKANYVEHKVQIEKEITASLARYPEIEERIIGDIDPAILVNFPELKSNETITAQFEALKSIEESILYSNETIVLAEKAMDDRSDNPMNMGLVG